MVKDVQIIVDSREHKSEIGKALAKIEGVTVIAKELDCGDYIINENCCVERKSGADFVASILDNRLFEQVAKMMNNFEDVIILLEGSPYDTRSAIPSVSIDGALSWLSLLSGVKVIHSPSVKHTPALLHRMAVHKTHGLGYEVPMRANKPKEKTASLLYMIEGLQGVGPSMARKLLDHFKSPFLVFSASVEDLCKVDGVGKKTAENIFNAIRASI